METNSNTVVVNVTVEISVEALQAIVAAAKQRAGRNEKGYYQVDTADAVSRTISLFLRENDFTAFATTAAEMD